MILVYPRGFFGYFPKGGLLLSKINRKKRKVQQTFFSKGYQANHFSNIYFSYLT